MSTFPTAVTEPPEQFGLPGCTSSQFLSVFILCSDLSTLSLPPCFWLAVKWHRITSYSTYYYYYFWSSLAASKILGPRPGIEPGPSGVRPWNSNPWTARECPLCHYFKLCLLGWEKRHWGRETKCTILPNRSLFYFLSCYFHVRWVKFVFPSLPFSREKGAIWTADWRTCQPLSPTQLWGLQRANPAQTSWEVPIWNSSTGSPS